MTQAAAILLVLLILGDVAAELLNLPIPGAAIGLVVLVGAFAIGGGPSKGFQELFDFAAPYFPMFFVPAAVGVVASLDVLTFAWIHITIAIVVGTAVTIVVTGLVAQALLAPMAEPEKTAA